MLRQLNPDIERMTGTRGPLNAFLDLDQIPDLEPVNGANGPLAGLRLAVISGAQLATAVVAKWEGQLIADEDTLEMIEEMEVEPA